MTTSRGELRGHLLASSHIQEAILSGRMQVGDRLPGERELSAELGVSRGAVREAIRGLQAYGVLESSPGPGRGTRIIAMQGRALSRMFQLHLATASQSENDLSETRVALERATCALAARQHTLADLGRLEELIDEMDGTDELTEYNDLDTSFHMEIAVVAGNPLLADLTLAIREALRSPIHRASLRMEDWQRLRSVLCEEHRGIYEAIATGNGALAADRVDAHIRSSAGALFLS
ncbi:FadR/GntR family transcriptional regulator [uncultured Tessaracoccus sp.]|uniref:FadR/GntR family transcriptional regulator n=1 Tax=uncultured Tessaracoccus sp. TaxID=905023 RepID=UPI0026004A1A|nr:FadR/GntR family transcriptional regulator [uncultured Tessaracoccus sp.]